MHLLKLHLISSYFTQIFCKESSIKYVLAKTDFLHTPLSTIVRLEVTPPPLPIQGRPDRIARINVRNAKYNAIRTRGGVSNSDKNSATPNFFSFLVVQFTVNSLPPPHPRPHWFTDPPPSFRPGSL